MCHFNSNHNNIKQLLFSSERVHNICELPMGLTIFVNAWFGYDTGVRPGAVLTYVIDKFMFF